ncbi:TBC1 domain family member 20-like isoform X1 [Synchiropus splendidus]|uniref:TBC1 domain family member 20-like isoform X1 n=1 Tax=Synchiropus splendidus TaxID=270530 RepID=UPI00237DADC7|nr:TBC1 domain family member 20-like isoform X1 [Synchiropus splendidus]XP_053717375.1 TBC1 domain family member 20-like isoform X1 [Synchiropus splendidus]
MRRNRRRKHSVEASVGKNGPVTKDLNCGKKQKFAVITQALSSDPVDIETLRRAASSHGGLLTDELRRKVWPKLLNINAFDLPHRPGKDVRANHKDCSQVILDVKRSMKRFPKGMPVSERGVLQQQLIDVILEVLKGNPQLHYYQGYHDVAVTLLLVVGERMAIAMLHTLSNYHLRDFMDPTMDRTKHILNYLMPLLEQVDADLHDFMARSEVGTIFALSWLITWYGHVLSVFKHTQRLYDFFLASHPIMPIYLAASIVLHRKREVMKTECDMAMVHHLLSHMPEELPYEDLICQSQDLFDQFPPSVLSKRAALQSCKSLSISTFKEFQLSILHQRPDSVLRRLHKSKGTTSPRSALECPSQEAGSLQEKSQRWRTHSNTLVKMAMWGLSATLGATVLAVAQTAMDWGPDLLQLF